METERAQKPDDHGGKILRLRDDGGVPPDNPFVGQAGYDPAIYSLGHRNPQGLAIQPSTGVLWETEHGPLGGDELNLIRAGHNYGWPIVTFGINYDGTKVSDLTSRADLESPIAYWVPSIGPSGLVFYSGNKFPAWRGNAFVGGMTMGRSRGTGQLQRLWFNQRGQVILREPLLVDLHQRIRSVYKDPTTCCTCSPKKTTEPSSRSSPRRNARERTPPTSLSEAATSSASDAPSAREGSRPRGDGAASRRFAGGMRSSSKRAGTGCACGLHLQCARTPRALVDVNGALYLNALPEQPRTSASGCARSRARIAAGTGCRGHRLPDGQPQVVP